MIIIQPSPFKLQMVGKLIEYEFLDERSNFKIWFGVQTLDCDDPIPKSALTELKGN